MPVNFYTIPFLFSPKSTLQLKVLILLPHALMMLIILFAGAIPIYLRILFFIGIGASVVYYYRLHIAKNLKASVIETGQDSTNNWIITTASGVSKQVSLLESTFNSNYLIINNYKDASGAKYCLIITQDSLEKEQFRRLKVSVKLT